MLRRSWLLAPLSERRFRQRLRKTTTAFGIPASESSVLDAFLSFAACFASSLHPPAQRHGFFGFFSRVCPRSGPDFRPEAGVLGKFGGSLPRSGCLGAYWLLVRTAVLARLSPPSFATVCVNLGPRQQPGLALSSSLLIETSRRFLLREALLRRLCGPALGGRIVITFAISEPITWPRGADIRCSSRLSPQNLTSRTKNSLQLLGKSPPTRARGHRVSVVRGHRLRRE